MTEDEIRAKYEALRLILNERQRRAWAAAEADAIGWGGISLVARATGMSRTTVRAGRVDRDRELARAEHYLLRYATASSDLRTGPLRPDFDS